MVSAQEPCELRIVIEYPDGTEVTAHQARVEVWGTGGSSEGTIAVATSQEKWPFLPINHKYVAYGGCKIKVKAKLDAADGLDVSDGVWAVPVTQKGAGLRHLNATNLGNTTDFPAATIAGVWFDLGTGFTVPQGEFYKIGGGTIFLSVEDDA